MTDNTHQEDAMGRIRETAERIVNGLVDATSLARLVQDELLVKVNQLDAKVKEVMETLETQRRRNQELDTLLGDVRRQRDEAQTELTATKQRLVTTENDLRNAMEVNEVKSRRINDLETELAKARDSLSKAETFALEKADELDKATSRLQEIESFARAMFPVPPPVPETSQEVKPVADPVPETGADLGSILPSSQAPHPVQEAGEPARIYEGDDGFMRSRPTYWDSERGKYWHHA